jgi:2Fe-2S type ferredoxin
MVDVLGLGLGLTLTLVVVALHFAKGTTRTKPDDIAQEVLEHRASTVPETDFPEPGNRAIGGGGGAVGAVASGEAEGELEEGEEEDTGFDPSAIPDDEVEYYEVEYVKEGETIEVANNENLLEAGEDEGWDLPYACREGQCLSCAGKITDGDAHEYMRMSNNEVLGDDELEKGYTLTCVAYPTADLTLETSESP